MHDLRVGGGPDGSNLSVHACMISKWVHGGSDGSGQREGACMISEWVVVLMDPAKGKVQA